MGVILMPFALIFRFISKIRVWSYNAKILKSFSLNKPVISVGNITAGGTGKTPFVHFLITQLEEKNLRVGLLTRGYGRSSTEILSVQGDSKSKDVGDEPLWLKIKHPKLQAVVGGDRVAAAGKLSDVDVIILDDGMQHLKIKRDLEITLIDVTAKDSDYWPLPAGRGREDFSALGRSDMVILTKTNLASPERVDEIADKVFKFGVMEVMESETTIESIVNLKTGESAAISGKKCFLVSGIAKPEGFETLVKEAGAEVVFHEKKGDHARINEKEITEFMKMAATRKADMILTTEKDAVKWKEITRETPIPVYILITRMTFNTEIPHFYDLASYNFH